MKGDNKGAGILSTPGFVSPTKVPAMKGDAMKGPVAPAPSGPIRDPLGIVPGMGRGKKGLPVGR